MMPHCSLALRSRKWLGSLASALARGNGQEDVRPDEHGEEVEARGGHQDELQRQHHEEGQDQAAVVASPGRRQGDELAQRQEREEANRQVAKPAQHPAVQKRTAMPQVVRSSLRKS
jgi:hypothetical protein